MSSPHPAAVEALLSLWESRSPGTPVRAVVDRAAALGFAATPPGGTGRADYLRLVRNPSTGRPVTLYVNATRLTAGGAAVRDIAAALPGAVVRSRDVQLPFDATDPFAVLETFRGVATGESIAAPAPSPDQQATAQFQLHPAGPPAPPWSPVQAGPPQQSSGAEARRIAVLALVGAVVLLFVLIGAITSGFSGAAIMLGLAAVLVGLGAVVVGRARWAFIASRGVGGIVVAAGLAVLTVGGVTAPAPTPASARSAATSSATATPTADPKAATAAAEAALLRTETEEAATAPGAVNAATGLLSDSAADQAVGAAQPTTALAALAAVEVKGRAPRTGYDRDLFGSGWVDVDRNGCDTRNDMLARDLTAETFKAGTRNCVVLAGSLADPYSARTIAFQRGQTTSDDVQIDHVVALSNSWQTGSQAWDAAKRTAFANDPLNLLAVDGPLNMQKGDGDAATWLPPNKAVRCAYVARQVAVKVTYGLWMTQPERNAIATVLSSCPSEPLPGGVVAKVPVKAAAAATTAAPAPAAPKPAPRPVPQPAPKPQTNVAPVPVPVPVPVPAPVPAPAPAPAPAGDVYYKNCDAVRAAGKAPLYAGQPGYRAGLDRGGEEGVACED